MEAQTKMKFTKGIEKPVVWVPALAAILSAIIIVLADSAISGWDRDATLESDQTLVVEAMKLERRRRQERLCELHHSNLIQSETVKETVWKALVDDPRCTKDGYLDYIPVVNMANLDQATRERVRDCLRASSAVTTSCQAYDKAGFHGRPGGACTLTLKAPEGHFFAQESVTVLSESYRQQDGEAAGQAMKPVLGDDGLAWQFSGRIGCTNKRGTGRTCSASATVRAVAFPLGCADLRDVLKGAE